MKKAIKAGRLIQGTRSFSTIYEPNGPLHLYTKGGKQSLSNVTATVFGGSSPLGLGLGAILTKIGSRVLYPFRSTSTLFNPIFREIINTADTGYRAHMFMGDMLGEKELDLTMRDSNVVICCIGSRLNTKFMDDFEMANIKLPVAIAKAVKRSKTVKRFILISAAGIDPNSPSKMLRTKWIGEQEVKEIYPYVTIFRPTTIVQRWLPKNTVVGRWMGMVRNFGGAALAVDGGNAKLQPIMAPDICLALLNALKLPESIGETYELGGPNTFTYSEFYELLFNSCNMRPYVLPIPLENILDMYNTNLLTSFWKFQLSEYLYPEVIFKETVDITVNPAEKTIKDLYVQPVAFGSVVRDLTELVYEAFNTQTTSQRERNYA